MSISQQQPPHAKVMQLVVAEENAGQRLDNFLTARLKGAPKALVYRIIRRGEVRVNKGRSRPAYKLQAGDVVRVPPVRLAPSGTPSNINQLLVERIEQAVIYEDNALLVVNKPSGLAVHGGSGISYGLIEALRSGRPEQQTLELVHRLDRETSGCVMVAKKRSMLKQLHELLRAEGVNKYYKALVLGRWPNRRQRVDAPLQKNVLHSGERMVTVTPEGKKSITEFRVCSRLPGYTLVEAKPVTGRTHQIRVHCRHAGHPIVGDPKYGDDEVNKGVAEQGMKRLFLHAERLEIPLPDRPTPLVVEAPLGPELLGFLQNLQQQ